MIRRGTHADRARLWEIRHAVKENRLITPGLVTEDDVTWFLDTPGIWLWEENGGVTGFSAGDTRDGSVWALFVAPGFEDRGIGRALLAKACDVLRQAGFKAATLSTGAGTLAEGFYRKAGWRDIGRTPKGEVLFGLAL